PDVRNQSDAGRHPTQSPHAGPASDRRRKASSPMTGPMSRTAGHPPRLDTIVRAALVDADRADGALTLARSPGAGGNVADGHAGWILALVYRNLQQAGVEGPQLPRLKGVYRRTWYVNQVTRQRLSDTLR